MDYVTIIGFTAATLTTIAFFPQVIKVWKTRETKDLSLVMFIILCTGVFLWIMYGILIKSLPVLIANISVFIMTLIILILKMKYK
jgi:MtN3 and saliva related transmembrane protein